MTLIDILSIVCIILFIVWQLYLFNYIELDDFNNKKMIPMTSEISSANTRDMMEMERISEDVVNLNISHNYSTSDPSLDILQIKRNIERYNTEQFILNEHIFGPLTYNTVVIVIQIHTRLFLLQQLISSLEQARGISDVLLIFSHDYYDEEMNRVVQNINFCKVMQIFYPYSQQIYPNVFPGESPGDCPKGIRKNEAVQMNCNNAQDPDKYGHYREAKIAQTKNHWWWKANRIFNQLEPTRYHDGLVLFLEEDHYVSEDFLYVLKLMEKVRDESCHDCNVLALGSHSIINNFRSDSRKVMITRWISSKHNIGMAFNRSVWEQIKDCAAEFCNYDDYNWDWTLQYLSSSCLKQGLQVMVARSDRVLHTGGQCGMHSKRTDCKSTKELDKALKLLGSAGRYLFPDGLILTYKTSKTKYTPKANGGWGDRRDHELCLNITNRP